MTTSEQKEYWYPSTTLWAFFAICALLISYPFMETIQYMVHIWDAKEEYGYGYIIPFITLFLIWQRKETIYENEFQPTYAAIPLLIICGVLYFAGAVSTTHTISQYAFVMTLLSIAFGVMGWQSFRIVAMPLVLLFFMIPLPAFIYNNLSGQLQLISSELGVAVIRLFGISVFLEGNVIDLGNYKLQVVEACSGLRYLFPLVSLSFVAAYLYNVEPWKRVVVFFSSIPITVLMNSFRIGVIGVLVEFYGIEQAEGFLHDFEGWFIFMACMGILFLEMAVLAHIGKNKKNLVEVFGIEVPDPIDPKSGKRFQPTGMVHYSMIALLAMYSVSTLYLHGREDAPLVRKDFSTFPLTIDEWSGRKLSLDKPVLDALKLDDYIIADYSNKNGDSVNFYVAYYGSQQAGAAAHSPRACIPGGGWKIEDLSQINFDEINVKNTPLSVNRLLIKKGDYGQLVYYWFQQRDRIVTNEFMVKWYLFWDALTQNRTDGSLIRLTTVISPGEDIEKADARLAAFLKKVNVRMTDFMPE